MRKFRAEQYWDTALISSGGDEHPGRFREKTEGFQRFLQLANDGERSEFGCRSRVFRADFRIRYPDGSFFVSIALNAPTATLEFNAPSDSAKICQINAGTRQNVVTVGAFSGLYGRAPEFNVKELSHAPRILG